MSKINRLAVLVAGDFRTFPHAAEYIFDHAASQAETVDYFFACWSKTSDSWYNGQVREATDRAVTIDQLQQPFIACGANLVDFAILNFDEKSHIPPDTAYFQSYLGKVAAILKRKHELVGQIIYDSVIELRPDLYIGLDICPNGFNDFEVNIQHDYDNNSQFPGATDFYYRCNSFTNDIMSERYNYKKIHQGNQFAPYFTSWHMPLIAHWMLVDYLNARRLVGINNFYPGCLIPIRPNFPKVDLRQLNPDKLHEWFNDYWVATRGPVKTP